MTPFSEEPREIRLRRLRMRSIRRGIKEMDLILGAYSQDRMAQLDAATLDTYDRLLEENDQELYTWVSGQVAPPEDYRALVADIAAHGTRG